MLSADNKDHLLPFSKHVPNILIRQSIVKLAERFVSNRDEGTDFVHEPSMDRFYGVLLFVDISGFTQLSSRMNVDDLRTHINAYFTLIISIVSKHGGEVVKFAGDALYIIWQIDISSTTQSGKHSHACPILC
jgi:class 3 adenylate cyclase